MQVILGPDFRRALLVALRRFQVRSIRKLMAPRLSEGMMTMEKATMETDRVEQLADLDTLRRLNQNFVRSVELSDVGYFEQALAGDFLNSNPDGSLVDRAGFLEQIARPAMVSELEAHDVRIRIMGDIAIIHARTTYRKTDGRAGAGRYTDVWARREGRWLCVSAHVSRG
jgi:ketosteroid isomerase-like protein